MQLFLLQKQALLGKKIVSLALHDVLFSQPNMFFNINKINQDFKVKVVSKKYMEKLSELLGFPQL